MSDLEATVKIIQAIIWPFTLVVLIFAFRKQFVEFFKAKKISVKAAGIEAVIEKFESTVTLSPSQRKELEYLTSSDIWALSSLNVNSGDYTKIDTMPLGAKVAAKSLLEIGLVEIVGQQVIVTRKGKELLNIAENILSER